MALLGAPVTRRPCNTRPRVYLCILVALLLRRTLMDAVIKGLVPEPSFQTVLLELSHCYVPASGFFFFFLKPDVLRVDVFTTVRPSLRRH